MAKHTVSADVCLKMQLNGRLEITTGLDNFFTYLVNENVGLCTSPRELFNYYKNNEKSHYKNCNIPKKTSCLDLQC